MQAITKYATQSNYLRLLLQGPPGSGKTTLAASFPNAYVIDVDVNLAGPLRFRTKRNLKLPVGYDRLDIDDNGELVPIQSRWARLDKCLMEAQTNDAISTIIIDSATILTDLLMAETLRLQPGVKDGRQIYGFFLNYGKAFLGRLTAMRKHVVLIAHERVEKDEMTGILSYHVAWPGQLGDYIGAFFTNAWRTEVKEKFGNPPTYDFILKTMPATQYKLKNDLELPSSIVIPPSGFDWNIVQSALDATAPAV